MRAKRLIQGLNNSQRIRVILDGVGFVATVKDVDSMPFVSQRIAVYSVLASLGAHGGLGLACTQRVYSECDGQKEYQVQVDLL